MKKYIMIFTILIVSISINAQKKAFTIEELYRIKNVGAPVLSNSEDKIAFSLSESNLAEGKTATAVYLMNTSGGDLTNISTSLKSAYSPFWSSDDQLYFLSGGQVYQYLFDSAKVKQITDFYAGISNPVISNDGKYIAFTAQLFPECGTDNDCNKRLDESTSKGPLQAYIADDLLFRHWTEYKDSKESYLVLYDLREKEYSIVAKSDVFADSYMLGGGVKYAFSPDSREICYVSTPEKNIAQSTNTDLYIYPLGGKGAVDVTSYNPAFDGGPVYSPDGKYIAYKTQVTPGYEADSYRVTILNRETMLSETLTEGFDFTVDDLSWSSDSKTIYFTANRRGYNPIFSVNIDTKNVNQVTDDKAIAGYQFSKDDKNIYLRFSSVDKPLEIYTYQVNGKSYSQITYFNKQFTDEVDVRPAEQIWVTGAENIPVHVFIVKPHNFDPAKKYPLVINVHGGPQMQWMDSFRGDWQVYPGSGYVVAFFNPHGSTGYGSKYTEAISGDWGGKVFEDVMKVTDHLSKLSYIDSTKMGAMGWSYGGYMMNWLQAKTKRYKCLASMMGVYDLESMWGSTEELWFANWDFKGQPWNSDIYRKYSPSNYVQNFATPTLILTGEKDYRVPYTQSIQYFTTLQTLGIDSRLIIFKNDGHWPNPVKSMPLYYNAHLEWFHKYLGGEPAPYDSKEMIKNIVFK